MEFTRILVPVGGSTVDDEAMELACRLAKKNKAKIWAVYVIEVKRTLPLEAEIETEVKKGEEILDHIETVAENEEYEAESDLLQSRDVGPTIIDVAVEREVDLILMGINYKRRLGQYSLGNVAPYILKNSPCRVILYQQPNQ